jgi:phosphoserine phosphatase RsbU/P
MRGPRGGEDPRGAGISIGLGLGLFIARSIAEAHGGSIEFTSSAKEGTTFSVSLPRIG